MEKRGTEKKKALAAFWLHSRALVLLLAVELLVVANSVLAAAKSPVTYTFTPDQLEDIAEDAEIGYDEEGRRGVTEFATNGQDILQTPEMTLVPGHYKVTLEYYCEPTMVEGGQLHHSNVTLKAWQNPMAVQQATGLLSEKQNQTEITYAVAYPASDARLLFHDDGGIFTVGTVTIRQDRCYAVVVALGWLLLFAAINMALTFLTPRSPVYAGRETCVDVLVITGTVVLCSAPLFINGLGPLGDDWAFHIQRIEGIAQGLREGQFPVRIYSMAKDGYGYSSSLFYGELFLYFPAILRVLGVNIQDAYKIYMMAVNAATAWIVYWCFCKMFSQRWIGRWACLLYTLSSYRLVNLYERTAVGEYTAMTFLPLVAYGMWLLYGEEQPVKNKKAWIPLAIGFSAILQCHMITMELTCLCAFVCCLIFWRKTFRPDVLMQWGRAAVISVLANLWFLVPFITTISTGIYTSIRANHIQEAGIDPSILFTYNNRPTIGWAMLAGAAVFIACLMLHKGLPGKEKKLGCFSLAAGIAACILSTNWFPWNSLERLGRVGELLQVIQFPWRYLSVATIALTFTALCAVSALEKMRRDRHAEKARILFAALSLLGAFLYYQYRIPDTAGAYLGDSSQMMYINHHSNLAYAMDNLYIPGSATQTMDDFVSDLPTNVEIGSVSKENGVLSVDCAVLDASQEGYMELPLLYYPGYTVLNENAATFASAHGLVGVVVPAGYSGTLQVAFREPKRWLLADAVSAATLLALAAGAVYQKRKSPKRRRAAPES